MKALVTLVVLAVALIGCRTEVAPAVRTTKPATYKPPPGECEVHDFPMATDVPAGAQNLGWVSVPHGDQPDEVTFEALRKAVCAKGGNAFSQAHWIRAAGASVADRPESLEANAWATP